MAVRDDAGELLLAVASVLVLYYFRCYPCRPVEKPDCFRIQYIIPTRRAYKYSIFMDWR